MVTSTEVPTIIHFYHSLVSLKVIKITLRLTSGHFY